MRKCPVCATKMKAKKDKNGNRYYSCPACRAKVDTVVLESKLVLVRKEDEHARYDH